MKDTDVDFFTLPEIDIYSLEKECATQATKFAESGLSYAQSQYKLQTAKLNSGIVKATVAHNARRDPGSFNLDKVTDKSIEMVVDENKEVKEAIVSYYKAELDMEEKKAIRDSWAQRGYMLRGEIDLWVSNYYSMSEGGNAAFNDAAIKDARKKKVNKNG